MYGKYENGILTVSHTQKSGYKPIREEKGQGVNVFTGYEDKGSYIAKVYTQREPTPTQRNLEKRVTALEEVVVSRV